jgi:FlaA1/EpsC-like NDP-sugar epimerase
MKRLCIYGCGGMGREIADLSCTIKKWEEIIFVDDNIKSRIVDAVPVFTLEETLLRFNQSDLEFIVAAGEPSSRKYLYEKLEQYNLEYINVINLAGLPAITELGSTFLSTTDPIPIIELSPMLIPFLIIAPLPK